MAATVTTADRSAASSGSCSWPRSPIAGAHADADPQVRPVQTPPASGERGRDANRGRGDGVAQPDDPGGVDVVLPAATDEDGHAVV